MPEADYEMKYTKTSNDNIDYRPFALSGVMSTLSAPQAKAVTFTVFGKPVPQGSTRAFFVKKLGRAVITTDNTRLKPWRQQISDTALSLNAEMFHRETPVEVTMNFYFQRPKSAGKRRGMTVKPDIDKICRSLLDGVTGILIEDDSQVVEMHARKHYGGPERVVVEVREAIA